MSDIQKAVQEKYGAIAASVKKGAASVSTGCCGPSCGCSSDPITSDLYSDAERDALPDTAVSASLGCGNPTALIDLQPGQIVLDLGAGGGIDVLLSAKRVGPTGKAYGLDMTDEMLALARENQRKAGATNVEFLKGTIEAIPLPDSSVDVIISNCVINLSSDKDAVLREAFRVLKPGGRFAVSDVVVRGGDVPADVRRNMELWVGCIAGALEEQDYAAKLRRAGFADVEVDIWRVYNVEDARAFLTESGMDVDRIAPLVKDKFASAFIRARKPPAARPAVRNVLFLCTGNSARSILAEALLNYHGRGRYRAFSAGSHPRGEVQPVALDTLRAHRVPVAHPRSKSWNEFAAPGAPVMDVVITVCDNAAGEVCPLWPGRPATAHWSIPDPAAVAGSEDDRRRAFEAALQDIERRVQQLVSDDSATTPPSRA